MRRRSLDVAERMRKEAVGGEEGERKGEEEPGARGGSQALGAMRKPL